MKSEGIKGRIWRAAWQSAAMVVLACVIGLLINESRSNGLAVVADWSPEARLATDAGDSMIVSLEEAERLCPQKDAVFVDARSPEAYARGHISCAINVPWQGFEAYLDRVWGVIPEDAWIATLLLVVFFGAVVFNLARGLDIHCGCFHTSAQGTEGVPMAWYVFRDSLFLIPALYLFYCTFRGGRNPAKVPDQCISGPIS